MTSTQLLSILLVLPGAIFILASIIMSLGMDQDVPNVLRGKWRAMTYLLFFFLAGYVAFLVIQIRSLLFPVEIVTSSVFLGGSLFVFLVIRLTKVTIGNVQRSEKRILGVNKKLLNKCVELEQEIEARRKAEGQAKTRLQHLATLHAVDMVITSSLDLKVTMKLFLEQAIPQLEVDAAVILQLDPHSQTLEYGAGLGFTSAEIRKSKERLGQGSAGLAALERRMVHIPELSKSDAFARTPLVADENFVSYYAVPLIAKGQVKGVLEIFHRAPLEPHPEWFDFLEALATLAAIAIDNATLFNQLQLSNAELILAYDTTIEGWSRALELRDQETQGHTLRVTETTLRMARALGMGEEELVHVRRGALLHDIGKMAVPDAILLKPETLTEEEQKQMQRHPEYAFELLSPIAYLRPALDIPYCHHEKWDGAGYPRGLKGEQIPLAARIFAIADIWDALISKRRYHAAWPRKKVIEHIRSLSGSQFDPDLVELFLNLFVKTD